MEDVAAIDRLCRESPQRVHDFLINLEELVKIVPGLVAALGTTIIRAAADQVIKQGFEAMRTTIEAQNQAND